MKKQPVNIYKDEDANALNLTKLNQHFQSNLEALELRIAVLETTITNHESRITELEP